MSYEEEDTCMSYEEEDTCISCEEEVAAACPHAQQKKPTSNSLTTH